MKHSLSIATSLCYKQYFGCAVALSGIAYNGIIDPVCDRTHCQRASDTFKEWVGRVWRLKTF